MLIKDAKLRLLCGCLFLSGSGTRIEWLKILHNRGGNSRASCGDVVRAGCSPDSYLNVLRTPCPVSEYGVAPTSERAEEMSSVVLGTHNLVDFLATGSLVSGTLYRLVLPTTWRY